MQKQKTVAKWLAIILVCTLAAGGCFVYAALSDKGGNSSAEGADTHIDSPVEQEPVVHVPYRSELPRIAESIGGVSVAHVGGEGKDIVHKAIPTADGFLVFFSTESTEYDVDGKGLYVASFSGDTLTKTQKISDGTFGDCKQSSGGIALVTKEENGAKLWLLNADGTLKAENAFSSYDNGKLHLSGKSLIWFYCFDGKLRAAQILSNTTVSVSPFLADCGEDEIKEIACVGGSYLIICESQTAMTFYTFDFNNGFNKSNSYDKLRFRQIMSIGSGEETVHVVSAAGAENAVLIALDKGFGVQQKKTIEGCSAGVCFRSGEGLIFVGNGHSLTVCKHLDVLAAEKNSLRFSAVEALSPTEYGAAFIAKTDSGFALFDVREGNTETMLTLEDCHDPLLYSSSAISSRGLTVLLSTTDTEGLFHANFGNADAFMLTVPRAENDAPTVV